MGTSDAPQPWLATKEWADRRVEMEKQFMALAVELKVGSVFVPWRTVPNLRVMGNTNKMLWMHLTMCSWKKMIRLEYGKSWSDGFLFIRGFVIKPEALEEFNAGAFPTVYNFMPSAAHPFQKKTLIKIWQKAGFVESLDGGVVSLRFDEVTFKRMRDQSDRADKRRQEKSGVEVAGPSKRQAVAVAPPKEAVDALLQFSGAASVDHKARLLQAAQDRVARAEAQFAAASLELREAHRALGEAGALK